MSMRNDTSRGTTCASVVFQAPYEVLVTHGPILTPAPEQVLVQTCYSAISAGTELLFYRGQVPPQMSADATIAALNGKQGIRYPLAYGYAVVGTVVDAGAAIDEAQWLGRRVFAFHPHTSHFLSSPADLIPIPEEIASEQAILLPNIETAVNFLHDGAPLLGEHVIVFGQGIVGLLTVHLLTQFPLATLTTVDQLPARRQRSLAMGATAAMAALPDSASNEPTADLVYELTGNPTVLNDAIAATVYSGRVVVGSWYGQKRAEIDLGGHFHRNRIKLISSQVSTVAPHLQGRWSKARRFDVAWSMLRSIDPALLITHRFPVGRAAQAYALLDQKRVDALQVILTYD